MLFAKIWHSDYHPSMGTMNISLPDGMKAFVDEQVSERGYGTSSEYVRDLIRREQDRLELRKLVLNGASSPRTGEADAPYFNPLRSRRGPPARAEPAMKPVFRRAAADQDVQGIVDYYREQAGAEIASNFVDALQSATTRLARQPAAGSPRYAHKLGIQGLRTWPLHGFPYRVFYFEYSGSIEVWRVLHERRDIPTHLQESDD